MNETDPASKARNANIYLSKKYASFIECVWDEGQKCWVYSFSSNIDAERFVLEMQLVSKSRFSIHICHANLTIVREFPN
jgi:hypothetical protein